MEPHLELEETHLDGPLHEPHDASGHFDDDPLEGDTLSSRRRSDFPSAYSAIAFVEGNRVLTITLLPPAA